LAELPYFTVVKPLTCEFGYIYSGALAYVGNGKVTAVQDDFYCSEPFAFAFYMNTEKREVATQYGNGLQILDTGHRLACGADYTTQKIFGDRVGDAYYYQDGVYYNGSDRALMAKSGECAVLLNGETCVGITDSYMGVRNCVEGFHRSDWIEIFLRENYPMDEDIYTMEDLLQYKTNPYVTTTTDDMTVFSLSDKGAYSDFVQPLPSRESKYRGVTVRVLQWDMEGDIVLYFYGDINMTGAPYEIEGLYVAKPRMEEESAENSGDGSRSCPACFNGDCSNCNGSGYVYSSFADTTLDCSLCTGGRCSRCGGSGRLAD